MTFLGFRKPFNSCTEGMCYSFTSPGTSLHVTRPFPALVLRATNTRVRRPGYEATLAEIMQEVKAYLYMCMTQRKMARKQKAIFS